MIGRDNYVCSTQLSDGATPPLAMIFDRFKQCFRTWREVSGSQIRLPTSEELEDNLLFQLREPLVDHDFSFSSVLVLCEDIAYIRSDEATISVALERGLDLQDIGSSASSASICRDQPCAASSVLKIKARTDNDLPMPISSASIPPPVSSGGSTRPVNQFSGSNPIE